MWKSKAVIGISSPGNVFERVWGGYVFGDGAAVPIRVGRGLAPAVIHFDDVKQVIFVNVHSRMIVINRNGYIHYVVSYQWTAGASPRPTR